MFSNDHITHLFRHLDRQTSLFLLDRLFVVRMTRRGHIMTVVYRLAILSTHTNRLAFSCFSLLLKLFLFLEFLNTPIMYFLYTCVTGISCVFLVDPLTHLQEDLRSLFCLFRFLFVHFAKFAYFIIGFGVTGDLGPLAFEFSDII